VLTKWTPLLTVDTNRTNQFILTQHRHRKDCSIPTKFCAGNHEWIAPHVGFALSAVENVSGLFCAGCAAQTAIGRRTKRRTFAIFDERCWRIMKRRGVKCISIVQVERTKTGSADASRVLQHGLENGLRVAWRARDHPQHLGRCGLLLHSLRSSVRWRSSLSSRANPGMVRSSREHSEERIDLIYLDPRWVARVRITKTGWRATSPS